jgi:hypothetical protein
MSHGASATGIGPRADRSTPPRVTAALVSWTRLTHPNLACDRVEQGTASW